MAHTTIDGLLTQTAEPNIRETEKFTSINDENIYNFMENAYDGTGGFRNGKYLVPHSREMFYQSRRDMVFYKNYVKPIVNAMVVPVFNRQISRKVTGSNTAARAFEAFIENADNAGCTLQTFMEDVLIFSRLHGVSFVIVDNFPEEDQPPTAAEVLEQRKFPYVYFKKANQVNTFKVNMFGKIERIMFFDRIRPIMIENKPVDLQTFIEWTDTQVIKYYKPKDKEELIKFDERDHNLGEVPVIPVYTVKRQDKEELLVDPPIFDIARLNHAIFNKDSEIRELERAQGFSIFYIQTEQGGNLTTGPNNVMCLPMATNITPGFASPDSAIQKNLMDYAEKLREDLFRIAEQNGVTGVKAAKSGLAIQWDFFAHEAVLKKTSMVATNAEIRISEVFGLYFGETFEYEVEYPMSFQPNDKLQEIKIIDMYLLLDLPPKAKAMAREHITRLLFSNKDPHELDEISKEIQEFQEDESQGAANDNARQNQLPFNTEPGEGDSDTD